MHAASMACSLRQHVLAPLPLLCLWQHLQVPQKLARACMVELSDISSTTVLPVALQTLDCFQGWAVSNRLLPHAVSEPGLPDVTRAALANSVTEQLLRPGCPST